MFPRRLGLRLSIRKKKISETETSKTGLSKKETPNNHLKDLVVGATGCLRSTVLWRKSSQQDVTCPFQQTLDHMARFQGT